MLLTGGILLFVYIVLRAIFVSFTGDEATTFLVYVIRPWEKILSPVDANNHLLNTILMRWTVDWLGNSVFLLRLPNVLAGGLFIFYSGLLAYRIRTGWKMKLLIFLLINCNVLVFELFSLARGYGLASGFLMMAVYMIYRLIETRKVVRYYLVATVALFLATLASFTVLNFTLFCIGALPIAALYFAPWKEMSAVKKTVVIASVLLLLLAGIVFVYYVAQFLVELQNANTLYFGEQNPFGSIKSVIYGIASEVDKKCSGFSDLYAVITIALFFLSPVLIFTQVKRIKASPEVGFAVFICTAMMACVLGHFLLNKFMDVLYPVLRTGGYLVVLWSICNAMGFVLLSGKLQKAGRIMFAAYALGPLLSFVIFVNVRTTMEWPECEGIAQGVEVIIEDSKTRTDHGIYSISCPFEILPVINYYLYTADATQLNFVHFDERGYQPDRDYYFIYSWDELTGKGLPVLYAGSAVNVLRSNRVRCPLIAEAHDDFENPGETQSGPGKTGKYSGRGCFIYPDSRVLGDTVRDTLPANTEYKFSCWLNADDVFLNSWMVVDASRNGQGIFWKAIDMSRFLKTANQWSRTEFTVIIPVPLLPGDRVSVYVHEEVNSVYIDDLLVERFNCEKDSR